MRLIKVIKYGEWTTEISLDRRCAKPYRVRTSSLRSNIEPTTLVDTLERAKRVAANHMAEVSPA